MIRDFLRSSSNVFLADLAGKSLGFFLIAGLTYMLSPVELGKYNALLIAATSICLFSGWGVPIVLQRQSAIKKQQNSHELGELISSGFVVMLCSIILVMIVLFLGLEHWQFVFNDLDPNLLPWLPVLVLSYFLVQSPLSVILGLGLFRTFSLRTAFEAAVTLICVIIGAYLAGLRGALIGLSVALATTCLVTVFVLRGALLTNHIRLSLTGFIKHSKRILSEGALYFIGNTLLGAIANVLMIALFARYVGYAEFGFLRVALSIAAIMTVIPNTARIVTVTYIARYHESSGNLKSLQIRYLMFAIVVSTTVISLLLYPLVSILFGDMYLDGIHIYRMVLYLYVILHFQQILNGFVTGHGELRYSGVIHSIIVLMYMAFMFFLIPVVGVIGYFIGFGLSYLVGVLILMFHEIKEDRFADAGILRNTIIVSLIFLASVIFITTLHVQKHVQMLLEFFLLIVYILWNVRYVFTRDELEKILALAGIPLRLN